MGLRPMEHRLPANSPLPQLAKPPRSGVARTEDGARPRSAQDYPRKAQRAVRAGHWLGNSRELVRRGSNYSHTSSLPVASRQILRQPWVVASRRNLRERFVELPQDVRERRGRSGVMSSGRLDALNARLTDRVGAAVLERARRSSWAHRRAISRCSSPGRRAFRARVSAARCAVLSTLAAIRRA